MEKEVSRRKILVDALQVVGATTLGSPVILYGLNRILESQPEATAKSKKPEGRRIVIPEGPVYSNSQVPANYCSRYVRLAARDLFGINYPADDAWKIRDHEGVYTHKLGPKENLENLEKEGILRKGMLVGLFYPRSRYNGRPDTSRAGYTHLALHLGSDLGELFFADKFGRETRRKISLSKMRKKNGLKAVEILWKN